jgi:hypothetical protein
MLLLGCDFSGGGPKPSAPQPSEPGVAAPEAAQAALGAAPSRVTYSADPAVYIRGKAIDPNIPYLVGGPATTFRVSPPLPPGLGMDGANGVITGTPAGVAGSSTYQVTASNSSGRTDGTVTITVLDQAPATAPAVLLPAFVTAGKSGLTASIPDQGPGTTYAWTLAGGTLTAGQGTPAITYSAGDPGALTVSVRVGNSGGSIQGQASASIAPAPEATLNYAVAGHPGEPGLAASVSLQPDMTYTWTVLPGTATATLTAGQGTHAIELTAGPGAGQFQVQVMIQNQAGDKASAIATIKVQE